MPVTYGGAAVRIALALAIGLMVGFEREWSNKDAGIRTCALTALLGMLAALAGTAVTVAGLIAILALVVFINLRALRADGALEITTSVALFVVYALGALVGRGDTFTPVAAALVATLLLTAKPELHRLAGSLHPSEIRAAIWLGLFAFVVYPLLPNRTIDRWHLVNPHVLWVAVIVVAAVGFANYVLMRLYSSRGMFYSAVLGGLVSSAAAVMELGAAIRELGREAGATLSGDAVAMSVTVTLLATLACFARNLLLLALFAPPTVVAALPALAAMAALAAVLIWRRRRAALPAGRTLALASPLSLTRVLEFGALFLIFQVSTELAQNYAGHWGTYAVAFVGGIFNSASVTAAVAELAAHHRMAPQLAGMATVVSSIASALGNAPVMNRALGGRRAGWSNERLAWALAALGAAVLALQHLLG
jgi:uncharacterized membrane protein (DUF4010 family)